MQKLRTFYTNRYIGCGKKSLKVSYNLDEQNPLKDSIGFKIHKRRKELLLTADELEKVCGVDRAKIYKFEKGKRNISKKNLKKILDALDLIELME